MGEIDKYLKYLENLRKENVSKKELKSDVNRLITKGRTLLSNLENNIDLVNEEDLKIIFSKIDTVDLSKTLTNFRNIKIFSKYLNDKKFMKQPQIITARKNLENIKIILENCLKALEKMIVDINLIDEEKINQQIGFLKRIKKKDRLSSKELKEFYEELVKYDDNDIDVNQIIVDVVVYENELFTREINQKNSLVQEKTRFEENTPIVEMKSTIEKQVKELSDEEINRIEYYKKLIEDIFRIGKKYNVDNFAGLLLTYQFGDSIPMFTKEVLETLGIELNSELVKLFDEFNEIVTLEESVRYLLDEEYLVKLRDILKIFEQISVEEIKLSDEIIMNIINQPKALVVFLDEKKNNQSFIEKDFNKVSKINKDVARLVVKKIVTDFYNHHVEPCLSTDFVDRYNDFRVAHTKSGRYARSFYINMSVSLTVKKFLKEKYNTDVVYLYTGFINIGNHESGYENEQYNRCKNNYDRILYLNRLFSKVELSEEDKHEISELIDGAIDITKKLNKIEGKKRYE